MKYTYKHRVLALFMAVAMFFLSAPVHFPAYAAETDVALPAPTVSLDFLPDGLIAESETIDTAAVINANSVKLYKSLDSGAEGIEVEVESGTIITLVTKYTFSISDTETLEFYRYDYSGTNEILAEAALSELSGYVFIYAEEVTIVDGDEILEIIYWELLETVSKEGYAEVEAEYADELALYTFSDEQQAELNAHYVAIPNRADIVYTPWSGRVGPLMPPVTLISPYSRLSYAAAPLADDDTTTTVDNSALQTTKKITTNDDGTYTITIEAYAEGQVTVTTTKTACDVILVLDMSSSMDESFSSTLTREQAVEDATQAFVSSIIADGVKNGTDHRVSVITYNTNVSVKCGLTNILTNAGTLTNAVTDNALETSQGTRSDLGLDAAIDVFAGDTSSYSFTNDTYTTTTRQRVVIFFTDGYPSTSGSTNFNGEYAKDAINYAETLKSDYSATVYSVAVLANADPDGDLLWEGSCGTGVDIGLVNGYLHAISSNYPDATATYATTSSSYAARKPGDSGGEGGGNSSSGTLTISNTSTGANNDYYLTASTPEDLNGIFNTVSNTVVSGSTSVELGTETVVKDIVTPYFVIPENATVSVQTSNCTGYSNSAYQWNTPSDLETSKVIVSGNTLDVSGFDFTHNFVAQNGRDENDSSKQGNFYGRKLIISFTITPAPDFLGGDGVPTNETTSGIYAANGTLYENLIPDPNTVNVPLKKIDTVAQNKHIYYGNATDLTGILNLHVKDSTSGKYLQDIANGVNNAYVDLVYTVTLNDSTVVTYTIQAGQKWNEGTWQNDAGNEIHMRNLSLSADTSYGIQCTMTSKSNRDNSEDADGNAWIYIYKPVLTFKDSEAYYQETIVNMEAHWIGTVWKRADNTLSTSNLVTMDGEAPTLTLTYTPNMQNALNADNQVNVKSDIPVSVTVTIQGKDTDNNSTTAIVLKRGDNGITFVHDDSCAHSGCGFDDATEEFVIHVLFRTTSLTVKKEGYSQYETIDPDQSFLFQVSGDGVNLIVTVHGNGSTTINGLKVGGSYTVTELTDWSWRYADTPDWTFITDGATDASEADTAVANITLGETGNMITFTNTRDEDQWLDGDTYEDNLFNQTQS